MDNVTVASRTQEDHDASVKLFLDAMHHNNFTLNETKTSNSVNSVQILGYVVVNDVIPRPPFLPSLQTRLVVIDLDIFKFKTRTVSR